MASCHSSQRTRIFRVSPEQIAGNGAAFTFRVDPGSSGNSEIGPSSIRNARTFRFPDYSGSTRKQMKPPTPD
jgi:hypothetical protein